MTARKDFLQSLTLGKKSEPTAEYAPSLRSPWRASKVVFKMKRFLNGGRCFVERPFVKLRQQIVCFFLCEW
ncbi:hypothetical protein [Candidiatus Paracoxiella cheracis]|uniref:hypothetical protein n=1 Tax=Candidiatus Paracoxiella cheracis TaxID=3405120 RepID=UPI003BF53AFC